MPTRTNVWLVALPSWSGVRQVHIIIIVIIHPSSSLTFYSFFHPQSKSFTCILQNELIATQCKNLKDTLMKEKRSLISSHSLLLLFSALSFSSLITQITQSPTASYLVSSSFCTKYRPSRRLITPRLPLLYHLPSLNVFPSPRSCPASFLLVARLLLLSVLFNFMPDFLSASAQSHKVSLSSQCCEIENLWIILLL